LTHPTQIIGASRRRRRNHGRQLLFTLMKGLARRAVCFIPWQ
jgi:hypothetical protein